MDNTVENTMDYSLMDIAEDVKKRIDDMPPQAVEALLNVVFGMLAN